MLRTVVIAVAGGIAAIGIVLIACGVHTPGWQALGLGAVVLLGTLFERWRYKNIEGSRESIEGQWQSTGERFLDPTTRSPVEVYYNPRTGERRYVEAKPPSS